MSAIDFSKLGQQDKNAITDRVWWEEFGSNPDNEIIQDPNWLQVITRSSRGMLANSISKCEVDEAAIDNRIQNAVETYRKLGSAFHWVIAPSSRPRDLAKRLTAAGMHAGSPAYGLIADCRKVTTSKNSDVTVEPLTGKNIHEYKQMISHDAFIEDHAVERHRNLVHHHLDKKAHVVSHFLARVQGKAAGIAQVHYHDGYAFIPGGRPEVKPEFAKSGAFEALVGHIAEAAAKKGLHVIATYAGSNRVPAWQKLGFEKTSEYQIYCWRPH